MEGTEAPTAELQDTIRFLKSKVDSRPRVMLVLGSGLGGLGDGQGADD